MIDFKNIFKDYFSRRLFSNGGPVGFKSYGVYFKILTIFI